MQITIIAPVLAAVLVGAAAPAQEATEAVGDRFRLTAHFDDPASAKRALAACEPVFERCSRWFEPTVGEDLLDVHLYRNAEDYRAADARLTGGRFARNLAFASHADRTAHVAIQPEAEGVVLQALGPSPQTMRLLAHEATHILRYHSFPNYRSHPRWLADGLASFVEFEVLAELGYVESVESYPASSTSIVRVRGLRERGALPSAAAILAGEIDELAFHEVYATHWLFFHTLATQHPDALRAWFQELRRLGGGPGFAARASAALLERVADGDAASLDEDIAKVLDAFEPQWRQVLRVLETGGRDWEQSAFDRNAICWRTTPAGTAWQLRAELRVLPAGWQQMNLLLGQRDDGFVAIAIVAGERGAVTVFDYRSADDDWRRVTRVSRAIPLDEFFPIEVRGTTEGDHSTLRIRIGGERLDPIELDVPVTGAWGLGAQAKCAGVWRDVRFDRK